MKFRKMGLVITILIILFGITACSYESTATTETQPLTQIQETIAPTSTPVPTEEPPKVSTFVVLNWQNVMLNTTQVIMYDPETLVMYTAFYSETSYGTYNLSTGVGIGVGISISPMYNADGTLRLYNPEN